VSRVALRPENLKAGNLENRIALNSSKLPFRPDSSKVSVERLNGNKVLLRQNNQSSGIREIKPESLS
jgi:hypothetical protein